MLHARGDARVPFDEGRRLAALIPGARFVPLQSDNHVLLEGEPAWPGFLAELRALSRRQRRREPGRRGQRGGAHAGRARGAAPVAQGLDNAAIARQLGKSEKTVRNQVSSIFDKLGVRTRAEAIVQAIGRRPPLA